MIFNDGKKRKYSTRRNLGRKRKGDGKKHKKKTRRSQRFGTKKKKKYIHLGKYLTRRKRKGKKKISPVRAMAGGGNQDIFPVIMIALTSDGAARLKHKGSALDDEIQSLISGSLSGGMRGLKHGGMRGMRGIAILPALSGLFSSARTPLAGVRGLPTVEGPTAEGPTYMHDVLPPPWHAPPHAMDWQYTNHKLGPVNPLHLPTLEESPSNKISLVKHRLFDIDLWVVCTGNTCRSAAMAMALGEHQGLGGSFNFGTCGSGVRNPGSPPTHAMWTPRVAGTTSSTAWHPPAINVAKNHQSKGCKPCQVGDNAVFAVVAEENADGLRKMIHDECPDRVDEINIVVMGDIEKGCNALRVDPYWKTKEGATRKGEVYSPHNERLAYDELVYDARLCVGGLEEALTTYLEKSSSGT